ncbi:hypothetical protein JYU34_018423 [Plutella xylostella]|uniref:Uncharacterized protein n=1 Tax=Plutella xylostella TaxID=51655 RepID=A0ABQ7PXU5_PLUXY|nr:hypothetical protein JYU34_018423 [Plutella xylostella]
MCIVDETTTAARAAPPGPRGAQAGAAPSAGGRRPGRVDNNGEPTLVVEFIAWTAGGGRGGALPLSQSPYSYSTRHTPPHYVCNM